VVVVGRSWVCHKFGCVRASMLAVTLYSVGAGIVSMSYNIVMLLVGRLILGVGVGLTFVTVNLYLVDIAPVKLRGATVMVFELSLCVGLTLGCVVTLMFMSLPPDYSWRVMVASPLPQGVLLLVALLRIPETPRFLMSQGLEEEVRVWLRMAGGPSCLHLTVFPTLTEHGVHLLHTLHTHPAERLCGPTV
jgi:MFS family permease